MSDLTDHANDRTQFKAIITKATLIKFMKVGRKFVKFRFATACEFTIFIKEPFFTCSNVTKTFHYSMLTNKVVVFITLSSFH